MNRLAILLSLLAMPALAADDSARKIDFTQVLADQDSEVFLECADNPLPRDDRDCKSRRPITLGMVTLRALSMPEQNLGADESLKRGALGLQLYRAKAATLTVEEISLVKKQISKMYGPLLVAITFPLLDPAVK